MMIDKISEIDVFVICFYCISVTKKLICLGRLTKVVQQTMLSFVLN